MMKNMYLSHLIGKQAQRFLHIKFPLITVTQLKKTKKLCILNFPI